MSARILLIGGHGKVSLLMTPLLLARSWHVTSLIRDEKQIPEIEALGRGQPGTLDVLVASLREIKEPSQAQGILDKVKPDWVVWSAGAGGKGGPENTFAIDRDAAKAFITASVRTKSVQKFLMVSYIGSRRNRPSWWTDEDWSASEQVNNGALANYFKAKVEADECLTGLASQRNSDFFPIVLRPGALTDEPKTGRVLLGKTPSRGKITRADVADVAVRLLDREGVRGWFDVLAGDEDVDRAIDSVVREKIDCVEGEDVQGMTEKYRL